MRWLLALCLLVRVGAAYGEEAIGLYYYERPPFLIRGSDGAVTGLIGDRVTKLAGKAGLAIQWQLMPASRQLRLLKSDQAAACGVGWYKTAQRESFAQFSHPIFRDRGVVVVANMRVDARKYAKLADLLADQSVSVLLKDGLTYGAAVAALLGPAKARLTLTTIEQPQMVRMVAAGRASLMFSTREEAGMLLTGNEGGDEGVRLLTFPDLPEVGEARYLMCSKSLDPKILARLDAAIGGLPVN